MENKRSIQFEEAISASPPLSRILGDWDSIGLSDCWVAAGAVVQSYWNHAHRYAPVFGIKDIDIIYHDPADLTEETEQHHAARLRSVFEDLQINLDVKNEARVHIWYEQKFGYPIGPYPTVEAAVATFPTTAGSVAVRPAGNGLEVCAPFGIEDLLGLIVRPNKVQITEEIYLEKVNRWRPLWPKLAIAEWNDS